VVGAKIGWKLVLTAFTVAVGLVANKAVSTAWKVGSGGKPPKAGQGGYAEVVTWAVASGAAAAAAKLFAERRAAAYWLKSTGYAPPGYEQDAVKGALVKSIAKDDA
jgi:Protein of unknown function (DUF4235)